MLLRNGTDAVYTLVHMWWDGEGRPLPIPRRDPDMMGPQHPCHTATH